MESIKHLLKILCFLSLDKKIMQKLKVYNNKKLTKLKICFVLLIAIIFITLYLSIFKQSFSECLEKNILLVLQSQCQCNKWKKIIIVENHNCEKDYSGRHFDN